MPGKDGPLSITADGAVGPGGPGAARPASRIKACWKSMARNSAVRCWPPSSRFVRCRRGRGRSMHDRACRKGIFLGGRVGDGPARHGRRRGRRRHPAAATSGRSRRPSASPAASSCGRWRSKSRAAIGFGPGSDRPTLRHGAFSFQVIGEDGAVMPAATWILRSPGAWQWQPLQFEGAKSPAALGFVQGRLPHSVADPAIGHDDRPAHADRGPERAAVEFAQLAWFLAAILHPLHS